MARLDKFCKGCATRKPLDAFATPRMRMCIECHEAIVAPYRAPLAPYSTLAGINAMARLRRRQAKLDKLELLPNELARSPRLTKLDAPRKCMTCREVKQQREYRPGQHTCMQCDKEALANTRPPRLRGRRAPEGR